LLAGVYERLKPWMPNHPDLNRYKEYQDKPACPTCTSVNTQRRGLTVKLTSKYYRLPMPGMWKLVLGDEGMSKKPAYYQVSHGEWIVVPKRGYKEQCCDCGLRSHDEFQGG
jgi:hypothetical protein